jgi:Mn-dependent DtxR family transcriptional regulator
LTLLFAKRVPARISGDLNDRALAVLEVMRREAVPLSTGEVAKLMSITNPTAAHHLKRLAEQGLVQRSGGAARDPYATWAVV